MCRPSECSILIVDDEPSIVSVLAEFLQGEGYLVHTAGNGAEALLTVEQSAPTVILLDMRMPVLDGWGFMQALQKRGLRVPILVMSAAQNARTWADEVQAAGYVAKPFNLVDMRAAVEQLCAAAGRA